MGVDTARFDSHDWLKHRWLKKIGGRSMIAGRYDFEIVVLDRFGVLPYELHACDPEFVDELQAFLDADAEHARAERRRLEGSK